jgi:chromosomal replication initiation ATPase DnaA
MSFLKHNQLETIVKESFQIEDLFLRSRKTNIVVARSVYFFILRKHHYSFPKLSYLSGRDHATVMNSIDKFERYYAHYNEHKSQIDYVISESENITNI